MIAATAHIIMEKDPNWGYYIEPVKFCLIYKASVTEADLGVLQEFTFCRSEGKRYIGSFIRTKARHRECLEPKVAAWTEE